MAACRSGEPKCVALLLKLGVDDLIAIDHVSHKFASRFFKCSWLGALLIVAWHAM